MAEDIAEIINVANLYALAVDSRRWDLLDEVFTADAEADYGKTARFGDLKTMKTLFAQFQETFDASQHIMSGHVVRVQGDVAYMIVYAHWRMIKRGTPGGDLWEGHGWYDDELVRTPAGWRIAKRTCRMVSESGNRDVAGSPPSRTTLHYQADAGAIRILAARG